MGLFGSSSEGHPAVYTADNEKIGHVKERREGGILIDNAMGKDYWLAERDVASNAKDRVVLIFSKSELDEYKREEPPPEDVPEGIPFTDAAFITEEEQMRMRRQMEDELAQQRSHLPG